MNRNGLTMALVAMALVAPAAANATPVDDIIAKMIATIDQKSYETHRRCFGWQQGIFELLTRLQPQADAAGAKVLGHFAAVYALDVMYGGTDQFLTERHLPLDEAAGAKAFGQGRLEWDAQAILPPERQYDYFATYGYNMPPAGCEAAEAKLKPVRDRVWHYEFMRELYGKDFVPGADPRDDAILGK